MSRYSDSHGARLTVIIICNFCLRLLDSTETHTQPLQHHLGLVMNPFWFFVLCTKIYIEKILKILSASPYFVEPLLMCTGCIIYLEWLTYTLRKSSQCLPFINFLRENSERTPFREHSNILVWVTIFLSASLRSLKAWLKDDTQWRFISFKKKKKHPRHVHISIYDIIMWNQKFRQQHKYDKLWQTP